MSQKGETTIYCGRRDCAQNCWDPSLFSSDGSLSYALLLIQRNSDNNSIFWRLTHWVSSSTQCNSCVMQRRKLLRQCCNPRQLSLDIPEGRLRRLLPLPANYKHEQCADNFLRNQFAAKSVESFDNSSFEGANHIVDMNQPLPTQFPRYDTILDFGTLEHIYIAPRPSRTSPNLRRRRTNPDILPANNFSGLVSGNFLPSYSSLSTARKTATAIPRSSLPTYRRKSSGTTSPRQYVAKESSLTLGPAS